MKTLVTTLTMIFASAALVFAGPGTNELSSYESGTISYSVEKRNGQVFIEVDLSDKDAYESLEIVRSDSPVRGFTRVLHFSESDLQSFNENTVLVDKYPLPTTTDAYYKIVVIQKDGVYRQMPGVLVPAK